MTQAYFKEAPALLAAAGVYEGQSRNAGNSGSPGVPGRFTAVVIAAQASAADGLEIQVSSDNAAWATIKRGSVVANTPLELSAPVVAQYYRVRYTNGATPQSAAMSIHSAFHAY